MNLIFGIILIFCYMNFIFILSYNKKDDQLIHIAWPIGIFFISLLYLVLLKGFHFRQLFVTALIFIWALRLTIYLVIKSNSSFVDFRFQKKTSWGKFWRLRSYLQIYLFNAILMFGISYPLMLFEDHSYNPISILDFAGLLLWIIGILFESIADYQKAQFKSNPQNHNKVCTEGFWRISRHPNYFGECCIWWGIFLLMLNVKDYSIIIYSPLCISLQLFFINGIFSIERSKKELLDFQLYKKQTSIFFPWFYKS